MIKLNPILREFLKRLVDAINERNSGYLESVGYINSGSSAKLDAPFIISSLYRNFEKFPERFDEFISDLEKSPDYEVAIGECSWGCDCDLFAVAQVDLGYSCVEDVPYYQIKFYYDKRYLGYCQCTPDMPDYREDKGCCGHNCDATFCSFYLEKVLPIQGGDWLDDEHDYWDFEDDFTSGNVKRRKEKERKERRDSIEAFRRIITQDTEYLNKLLEEDARDKDESRENCEMEV